MWSILVELELLWLGWQLGDLRLSPWLISIIFLAAVVIGYTALRIILLKTRLGIVQESLQSATFIITGPGPKLIAIVVAIVVLLMFGVIRWIVG